MRRQVRMLAAVMMVVALAGCASGGGGSNGRAVYDTRDLVVDAQVPPDGLWYVAEATAADAVDDVMVEIAPAFDGDVAREPTSGLAPMLVSGAVPADLKVSVDLTVSSFDSADNAEVRCSVYFEGSLVVENVATGASPVAECVGDFDLADDAG